MDSKRTTSALPLYAVIFGLLAIGCNLFLIPLPLGFLFGVTAFILGIISCIRYKKRDGFMLSLISFLLIVLWIGSIVVPILADPTLMIK